MCNVEGKKVRLVLPASKVENNMGLSDDANPVGAVLRIVKVQEWFHPFIVLCETLDKACVESYAPEQLRYLNNKEVKL